MWGGSNGHVTALYTARILVRELCRGCLASVPAILRPDRGTRPPSYYPSSLLVFLGPFQWTDVHCLQRHPPGGMQGQDCQYNKPLPGQNLVSRNSSAFSCPRDAVSIFPLPGPEMKSACGRSTLSEDLGCSSPAPATKPRQYPNSICADPFSLIVCNAKIFIDYSQSENVDLGHSIEIDTCGRLTSQQADDPYRSASRGVSTG